MCEFKANDVVPTHMFDDNPKGQISKTFLVDVIVIEDGAGYHIYPKYKKDTYKDLILMKGLRSKSEEDLYVSVQGGPTFLHMNLYEKEEQ